MSLQFNSPYIANTASNNYVSSNGSTLTVNEKSNTKEGLSKEVIVIDDDSDNDENTISQYKNKGNLDVSIAPCIATKGELHGTDDMVVSNIAVQSDQGGIQLLENTVISPNRNEKQDPYDLYYKEVEEMLYKLDQVKDGLTDVEKADSSNTDEFLCGRYGIATTYSNDDDKGKETIDELNSGAANSAVESAKQRIAQRFKLLQPKRSNMECCYCGKAFEQKTQIYQHLQTHTGRKSYKCSSCGKAFGRKSQMDQNLRTHTGERPYMCSYCGKAFAKKSNMDTHLRTHTGEKPYECSYCGKAFAAKSNMDTHLRTHTGEKPYECSYCGKAFAHKSDLHQHLRTHTGEKPYKCSYCGKAFARKSNMDRHLRTHTGEKPYECSYCGKVFAQKGQMDQHLLQIHALGKPLKCPNCDKEFRNRYSLKTHLRTHTGGTAHK